MLSLTITVTTSRGQRPSGDITPRRPSQRPATRLHRDYRLPLLARQRPAVRIVMEQPDQPERPAAGAEGNLRDSGYDRIVRDFHQAMQFFCEVKGDYVLLYEAMAASWRQAGILGSDPIPFALNLSRVAKKYGCHRDALRARRDRLIAIGVLRPRGDGTFLIDKRCSHHRDPGTGRVPYTPDQQAEIRAARRPKRGGAR